MRNPRVAAEPLHALLPHPSPLLRAAAARFGAWLRLGAGAALTLTLGALPACGDSLKMTRINSASDKPNNVWVFFTVQRGNDPVAGLEAKDFKIYEDDGPVSELESKQVILNPQVAAVMYTMLLVDVSGSITESGKIGELVDAAQQFVEKVGKTQKVAVYAFDGEEKLHAVVPFTETEGQLKGGLDGLRSYKPKDPSTNLHGAVVQGTRELKSALDKEKKPLKFGTVVVFSDGADRASRVSRKDMLEELKKPEYEKFDFFAIGIGTKEELEQANLKEIGRNGTEEGTDQAKVKKAFDTIADKIDAHSKRFYLLSYCTPARGQKHKVRIEVETKEPKGHGKLEYEFDADKFGPPPDCDPQRAPNFDLAPDEKADKDGDKSDGKSKSPGKLEAGGSAKTGK